MARREKERQVFQPPLYSRFKPVGVESQYLNNTILSLDEFEALRLADYVGLSQIDAAENMNISRPTFTRLIEKARKKLIEFIIQGNALQIDGGNIHFKKNITRCLNCGQMFVIDIEKSIQTCPNCESSNLINLAGGFGHGKCCVNHKNRR